MSDALLNEFIFDSREHLGTAGAQLLELEKDPSSLAALNALMGTMHTIKGNSGFLDLRRLYRLLHHAESLLQTIREQRRPCSQKLIDLLLQVLDTVEALLDRLESGADDDADWLEALSLALSAAETGLEAQAAVPETALPRPEAAPGPEAAAPPAQAPPRPFVGDDLSGRVEFLALADGQLSGEEEIFPARVEAMFEAGLRGLVIDLRKLTGISGRELKALTAAARKNPERTGYLLDLKAQQALHRVFLILNLDRFMRFFPDREPALAFVDRD